MRMVSKTRNKAVVAIYATTAMKVQVVREFRTTAGQMNLSELPTNSQVGRNEHGRVYQHQGKRTGNPYRKVSHRA